MIDSTGVESCSLCLTDYTLVSGSCEAIATSTTTLDYYIFAYSGY